MVDEQSEGPSTIQEVFSIFIIKNSAQSLRQAETYLRNRGWTIGSAVNMRESLAYVIQNKPDYVLVCADHNNKKIMVLPKLLVQSFPVKIIAFADSSAPSSMGALREMNEAYTLYPPVSGPAIERMVLKIKKDGEAAAKEALAMENLTDQISNDSANSTFVFKGENVSSESAVQSFKQAQEALSNLMNSPDTDTPQPSGIAYNPGNNTVVNNNPQSYLAKGQSANTAHEIRQKGQTPKSEEEISQKGSGPGDAHTARQKGSGAGAAQAARQKGQGPGAEHEASQEGPMEGESFAEWEKRTQGQRKPFSSSEDKNSENGMRTTSLRGPDIPDNSFSDNRPDRKEGSFDGGASAKKQQNVSTKDTESKNKLKEKKSLFIQGKKKDSFSDIESIVVRGAVHALDETVVISGDHSDESIQQVQTASNIACITVQSSRFSGYLVAALGKNKKIDKDFMNMIKQRLFAFLKANGEEASDSGEDSMGLQIKEVEFEGWALEQAEFLRKSIHDGNEIAMAFFPTSNVSTKLDESISQKMLKMSLNELKDNVALEFDLYIYMPENNKYLLYTPQGKPLYTDQKGRLQEKGITHLHLRKESIQDVKKYRAQNFLNEKIEAYKAARANKTPH